MTTMTLVALAIGLSIGWWCGYRDRGDSNRARDIREGRL